jgi:hypothetical protein
MKISAPWRNKEDYDMHMTAAMMTCARQQCLMITHWHKIKIGVQWHNNEDQRNGAKTKISARWLKDEQQ